MKKYLLLIALVVTFLNPPASYSATSAEKLVGHWSTRAGDNLYFGKAQADGIGSYIQINGKSGKTSHFKYKIVRQDPAWDLVSVELLLGDGYSIKETYIIPKDGKEMEVTIHDNTGFHKDMKTIRKRVDNKIEP